MTVFFLVVAGGLATLASWWYWITRPPSEPRDLGNVSQLWRDEHSRERRDEEQ